MLISASPLWLQKGYNGNIDVYRIRFTVPCSDVEPITVKGPFKCYVTQMGGGCQIFLKKALRRCNVQCY